MQNFSYQIHGVFVSFAPADFFGVPVSTPVADSSQFARHESMNDGE
jgi:hypothetical protein